MTILLLTQPQAPTPIAEHVRALAPEIAVETDAARVDARAVRCVVAYRLAPGVLSRFPNLRLLCAASSGVEKLLSVPDLPAQLPVVRVTDPMQAAQIAQYVCGHAIAHVRRFDVYRAQHAQRQWLRHPPPVMGSMRATVLGTGHTGAAVARMLTAVGFDVQGWSRSARAVDGVPSICGDQALAARLADTDVLVNTLPCTPQTRGLLNATRLSWLPAHAQLINVGRGEVLDDLALDDALRCGRLTSAVLDAHRQEPLPADAPQWRTPGLLVMPHVASQPSAQAVARTVVDALRREDAGQPHPNLVDRARGY